MEHELYPTKTRLALLRGVAASQVQTARDGPTSCVLWFMDAPESWTYSRNVTARMAELQRAGWVVESEPAGPGAWWLLTDAGRKLLEEHP